jgi:hypothetical protein
MSVISAGSRPAAAHAAAIGDVQVVFLLEDHGATVAGGHIEDLVLLAGAPGVLPARRAALRGVTAMAGVVVAVTGLGPVLLVIVGYERDRGWRVPGGAVGCGLNGRLRARMARLPGSAGGVSGAAP